VLQLRQASKCSACNNDLLFNTLSMCHSTVRCCASHAEPCPEHQSSELARLQNNHVYEACWRTKSLHPPQPKDGSAVSLDMRCRAWKVPSSCLVTVIYPGDNFPVVIHVIMQTAAEATHTWRCVQHAAGAKACPSLPCIDSARGLHQGPNNAPRIQQRASGTGSGSLRCMC
jgi:hypothetical protein